MTMRLSGVMSSIFWGLIAFAVALVGFGIFRTQQNAARSDVSVEVPLGAAEAATGPLVSPAPYYEFGTISMGAGKVSHRFRIRNTGGTPVTINRIYTSCMCTEATLITATNRKGPFGMPGHGVVPTIYESLPPGGSAEVEVWFDPAAHGPAGIGPTDRVVTVQTYEARPLSLRFTAMVKP